MKRYPAEDLTPHAAYHTLKGRHPIVTLTAFDDSARFTLMGGPAIPNRFTSPESVIIQKDGLKGLIAPWDTVDQKGATEDGVTFIDALQSPTEVEIKVTCRGATPKRLRRVVRDLIASIDKKRTSVLEFVDQDAGVWWSDLRWFKGPPEPHKAGESFTQNVTLVLRADNGFWRTFADTDSFQFDYDTDTDTFSIDDPDDLGAGWKLHYYDGDGSGTIHADDGAARWDDDTTDPDEPNGVMCLRDGYESETDSQVVSVVHETPQEFSAPTTCFNDIWARCNTDGSGDWDGDGIRLRYGFGVLILSRFNNFIETVMCAPLLNAMIIPPLWGEKFTLVAGYEGDLRKFKVLRNGVCILSFTETGTGSALGDDHRSAGFGMRAGAGIASQATPGALRQWSAGDNSTTTQWGFLRRINIGDQPMPDKYTVFGPGTFHFADGPGTTEMIEFGPLLPNQVVWIDTSRQKFRVRDLTSTPPTPQQLKTWQQALKDFLDFAAGNNASPLVSQIESVFGIVPPQGNLYSLLKGRWSKRAAIPPKVAVGQTEPYFVKVGISGGNADSRIVVSGTPLRRYPL